MKNKLIFYRVPVLCGAAILMAALTETLLNFRMISKLGILCMLIRCTVFAMWWYVAARTVINQYYRSETGRKSLRKDEKELRLGFKDLLERFAAEKRALYPPVPAELTKEHNGIFFGKTAEGTEVWKNLHLDGAVLVVGGAGSGKSSCISIPTIRKNRHVPMLVVDIKGELAEKGLSPEQRSNTKIFAPADPHSDVGFDPFYLVKQMENPVPAVREIALALIELPERISDPFWISSAQNVFTGALLYGLTKNKSFLEVVQWLLRSTPDTVIEEIKKSDCESAKAYTLVYAAIKEETLGAIYSELSNHLIGFATDPDVSGALKRPNLITPDDLENDTSIFLNIPEEKLEQWRGLLTIIINLFLKAFERRGEGKKPIIFLLEETPRLGKLRLVQALATLRSRGIVIVPVIQSIAQLDLIYGDQARRVICDNCRYTLVLGCGETDSCEWMSRLAGVYEKTIVNYSHDASENETVTVSKQERRRILPEEFQCMTDIILFNPINGFCRLEKSPYYRK